ncbi:hypothetical protein AAFN88_07845 [Pelagibius sp. CAU 1746]|uniref:hypothetical protein n=1 Tax=Pelagibius sp. CAU 1746 TaxID=3140370 RepID=UPI00325B9A78
MTDPKIPPLEGGDFPEETELRAGPMDVQIMRIAIEALNKQGHPEITAETLKTDPEHRRLVAELLRDCRPLPVVLSLIEDLERQAG